MSIALDAFAAGATAYDHANHALTWAHTHIPLLAGVATLTGFAAGLWLRRGKPADSPTDLDTCNAIWAATHLEHRRTRKGDRR